MSLARAVPIDALRAFVAVIRARGFTRAAEELGRSQPTVSLQVKRLEELMATPLFADGGHLRLTKAGKTCLDHAGQILRLHDEMLDAVERASGRGGAIRIGMPGDLADALVPKLAARAMDAEGAWSFAVACESAEALGEKFRRDELDLVLAPAAEPRLPEALARWTLALRWARAPSHSIDGEGPLKIVAEPEGAGPQALRAAGREFHVVCESADFNVRRLAIEAGFGIGALLGPAGATGVEFIPDGQIAPLAALNVGLYGRSDGAGAPLHAALAAVVA